MPPAGKTSSAANRNGGYQRRISKLAAQFSLDWVCERARQIRLTDPQRRGKVLAYHRKSHDFWRDVLARANAD